jgi:uncharacterized protein YqgV (UPF0045/DUF77 family)
MNLTAEISMYPLHQEYEPIILEFIANLRTNTDIDVVTNAMSTQVRGPYQRVWEILQQATRRSFEAHGKAVFVVKFIGGELPILDAPITE